MLVYDRCLDVSTDHVCPLSLTQAFTVLVAISVCLKQVSILTTLLTFVVDSS